MNGKKQLDIWLTSEESTALDRKLKKEGFQSVQQLLLAYIGREPVLSPHPQIKHVTLTTEQIAQALTPELRKLKLLKTKEAAVLMSMTPQGFRKLALAELDYVDVGGQEGRRWSLADIEKLQAKRRVEVRLR